MPQTKRVRFGLLTVYLSAAVLVTLAALHADISHEPAKAPVASPIAHAADEMAAAAQAWWTALTPELQAKAHFDFDNANRVDWHFIPRERKGLPYRDMNSAQRCLAVAFLSSGLSTRGFIQAESIMSLDQILKDIEPGPPKTPYRDPENYSFTLFGQPGAAATWGWRVEGHHLSVNFTIVDGKQVVGGPIFYGTNPAEVREGPRKGLRILALEEDLGFALINSLSDAQKKTAIFDQKAPKEIITGHDRKANPGAPVGIAFAELTEAQKKSLVELTELYAHKLRSELANNDIEKIEKSGWDKVHFAWAGALAPGEPHYYRIHGATFLAEFDSVQGANHIHSVWRDAANDFGDDLLKEHYAAHPH